MTDTMSLLSIVIGITIITLLQYSTIVAAGHSEQQCSGFRHRRLLKDPEDCTRFKACFHGNYRSFKCPFGRQFNERKQKCTKRKLSECPRGGRCAALDNGVYRASTDCSRHFQCKNNDEVIGKKCKGGLLYDLNRNMCTFPELVTCPVAKHQDLCSAKQDGYHQHPLYCSRYFYCISGYIVQSNKCNYGLLFDNVKKECTEASTVFCPPVFGGWSSWREGRCSSRCGKGFLRRYRTCTNPSPANGGKNCLGRSSSIIPCETDSCKQYRKKCTEGTLIEKRYCQCPSHTLNGRVQDQNGNPIADARIYRKVKMSQTLATSSADGSFKMSGICANENEALDAKRDLFLDGSNTAINSSPAESTVIIEMQRTEPLIIIGQPRDTMAFQGEQIVLTCKADGMPLPSYEWYKEGSIIKTQSTASNESTYVIQSAEADNAGLYRCKAVNSYGSLFSDEVNVKVYDRSFTTDSCDPTPIQQTTELPFGCFNTESGMPLIDIGSCSDVPCISKTTSSEGPDTCCRPATFKSVIIQCDEATFETSIVASCSCQPCQEKKTVIFGVIKESGTEQHVLNAVVNIDGKKLESGVNFNGQFTAVLPMSRGRSVISISSDGDAPSIKVIEFNQQEFVFVQLYITRPSFSLSFSTDEETSIPLHLTNDESSSFGTVTIQSDSLTLADGATFNGSATVAMTVIDPRQLSSISASVGDFTTIDEDGLEQTLQTSGMFAMSFKTDDGQRLRLTKAASVLISADEVNVEDGANIYYLDSVTGRWVKMSALTRQDSPNQSGRRRRASGVFYIGSFTEPMYEFTGFYNIDKPWRPCYVNVKVKDPLSNGNVAGSLVSMIGKAGQMNYGFNQAVTGSNGVCVATICKAGGWLTSEHEGQLLYPGILPAGSHNGQPTQIDQSLFISFGSHLMPSTSETSQFINDAQSSAILGPIYSENQKANCKNPAANSLSFEFIKPPVLNPNQIFGKIVNKDNFERLSWHSNGVFPTHCSIKVVVIGKPTPIVVKSYTHDKSQEYGTMIVTAQQDPNDPETFSACIPYKCTETIFDGGLLVTPIDTIVQVAPSASNCSLRDLNPDFATKVNKIPLGGSGQFTFEFNAPELTTSEAQNGLYFHPSFGSLNYDRRQNLANCRQGVDNGGDLTSNTVQAIINPTMTFDCKSGGGGIGQPLK